MSIFVTAGALTARFLPTAEEIPFDDKGYTTIDPIFPPLKELVPGTLASLIIFTLLWKFAWPSIKKSMNDRTARVQQSIDDAASAKVAAQTEAESIRHAQGDIEAERTRLLADADAQATALLADGRARIDVEMAELEARAITDIEAAATRGVDELRAEIARGASTAIDRVVEVTLDDAAHQDLIEGFIARVGASTGASS